MSNFQLYHCESCENKLPSLRWWCPLCTRPTCLVSIFIGIVQYYKNPTKNAGLVCASWNHSLRIDIFMSIHSDTLSWLWANLSLPLFLNSTKLSREAANTNLIVFGLTRLPLKFTIYWTWGEYANPLVNSIMWLYIQCISILTC